MVYSGWIKSCINKQTATKVCCKSRRILMQSFKTFLKEEAEADDGKLKHIHHAEDRPLFHGAKGFEHAVAALKHAHELTKSGGNSSHLTMKYDGSPSIVFGRHPENGKFFVASKSAFNKKPKINYTHKDIEKNHGHAPGLVEKLHAALDHLKKVTPKTGVYQGDLMHSGTDVKEEKGGKASFTPNTITYTASGDEAEKVKRSKVGIVTHTQYQGKTIDDMKADPHPDLHNFGTHPDVWQKSPNMDTKQVHYSEADQEKFNNELDAADRIHQAHKNKMYADVAPHAGETGHLATYINHTVRTDEVPSADGLKKHIESVHKKALAGKLKKMKTPAGSSRAESTSNASLKSHLEHIDKHKESYEAILRMHRHLQNAKGVLVDTLEQHTGGLEHHIDGKPTGPEGFVVNHAGEPTKLVNRKEFAKANLLKVRKK